MSHIIVSVPISFNLIKEDKMKKEIFEGAIFFCFGCAMYLMVGVLIKLFGV